MNDLEVWCHRLADYEQKRKAMVEAQNDYQNALDELTTRIGFTQGWDRASVIAAVKEKIADLAVKMVKAKT
jgi:hypothetical protein